MNPGEAVITAKVDNFTDTCDVTVLQPLKGISLNKTSFEINVGSTEMLTVYYDPTNTTNDKTVTWTSSDTSVATVSGGLVTPHALGYTTVTAKVGSYTATCVVDVKNPDTKS